MLQSNLIICVTLMVMTVPFAISEEKNTHSNATYPMKRGLGELSFSYAATDIGSKAGTHIKTITVIKNVGQNKEKSLVIDPELHKDNDWGTIIRNNFDKYGKIPDIPEIVNLDGYLNSKTNHGNFTPQQENREEIPIYETPQSEGESSQNTENEENQATDSSKQEESTTESKLELPEDVELLNPMPIDLKSAELSARAQSLRFGAYPLKDKATERVVSSTETVSPLMMKPTEKSVKQTNASKIKPEQYKADTSISPSRYTYPQSYNFVYTSQHTKFDNGEKYSVKTETQPNTFSDGASISSTVQTPYLAPNKKIPVPVNELKKSVQVAIMPSDGASSTSKPYIAPKYSQAYKSQASTNSERYLPTSNVGIQQNNNNNQRFRGLRYK